MPFTTISSKVLPAGTVVQVVRNYQVQTGGSNHISTTSTSYTASGIQASITPTASGNLILVNWVSGMTNATNEGLAIMYQRIGSGSFAAMNTAGYHMGYRASTAGHDPMVHSSSYTATSTDTLTYEPYIKTGGTGTFYLIHGASSYALTLTEVQQ